jgi:hypothetical protein
VLELGRFLVSEALGPRSDDTLSRWLLHAIAERIKLAEEDVNPSQRNDRENEAAELIVRLWKHRAVAPIGIDPLARYERLFKSLSILLPESNPWQARETTPTQRVAADLYRCLTSLSVGLLLLNVIDSGERSVEERDLLDKFLPTDEKAVLALFEHFNDLYTANSKDVPAEQAGRRLSKSSTAMLATVRAWLSRTIQAIEAVSAVLDALQVASVKSKGERRETQEANGTPSRRKQAAKMLSRPIPKKRAHSRRGRKNRKAKP